MRLEHWSVIGQPPVDNPYLAPELWTQRLYGQVFEHPNFPDGVFVTTSRIVGRVGETILTKSGSHYTLGEVDPDYEKLYPSAKERLLASLKDQS